MIDFEERLRKQEEKIHHTEQEITSIKEKIIFSNITHGKIENTLEKVQELMEDRRENTDKSLNEIIEKINESERRMMVEIKKIQEELKSQYNIANSKIDDLNKWRWLVVGGSIVIGIILSSLAKIFGKSE